MGEPQVLEVGIFTGLSPDWEQAIMQGLIREVMGVGRA